MKQLDPDDYLDAYRATHAPREATLNAVYARLQAELGPGSGPLGGDAASGISGTVKVLVGLALAVGLGLILVGRETPSPDAESRITATPKGVDVEPSTDPGHELPLELEGAAQPPNPAPASVPASQPPTSPAQAQSPSNRRPGRPANAVPADPRAADAVDLAEDLRAIKRIRADVISARFDEAIAAIERHRLAYPDSPLAKERTVLELEARCGSDGAGALIEARRFLDQNPASTMAERVRIACELRE